jgi:tRNA threonylcarbamoyladenosine biosynthesis protein TsaE
METVWQVQTEVELAAIATEVATALTHQSHDQLTGASVLALHGDLGAGKTTFMQTLASTLGVRVPVTSPTFVIMKTYDLAEQTWQTLVHIDAYRVEDLDEMRPLQFGELLTDPTKLVCVEWAEKIAPLLPPHTLHLDFTIAGAERELKLYN